MMSYPPPQLAQGCQCVGQPMKAMLCMTGHMLECHYPLPCRQAVCGHLVRYDWEPNQVAALQVERDMLFTSLADKGCSTCQGSGSRTIETTLQEVYGEDAIVVGQGVEIALKITTFCDCVWRVIERAR